MPPADAPVPIAIIYRQDELAILTARLWAEGIGVLRHSGGTIAANAGWTLALGGVRLFVLPEHAEEAQRILAEAPAWERRGVYLRHRTADAVLAVLLMALCGVPPPARIPPHLISAERTADR